jgi:hypothetical protein
LNPRPADYKSAALPAELHQHFLTLDYYITDFSKKQGGICEKYVTFQGFFTFLQRFFLFAFFFGFLLTNKSYYDIID